MSYESFEKHCIEAKRDEVYKNLNLDRSKK